MDPLTIGLLLSGGSSLLNWFGGRSDAKKARKRQAGLDKMATGMFSTGPGAGEDDFLKFLFGAGDGSEMNNGQDGLLQMMRRGPIDTADLFKSWEPMEQRALDQSLGDFWGTTSGLGERFGSAAALETGKIRQNAAESAAARREETSVDVNKFNEQMQAQLAQLLIGGFGTLAGAQNQRRAGDINLLSLMYGQNPVSMPNIGQPLGDIGQLFTAYPFLKDLMS